MKVTVKAPAKINLYLDVVSKRVDGYHDIKSIMHTVSLADIVTVEKAPENIITLTSNFPHVPTDDKNIAYKAAKVFFEKANIKDGAKIHIEKHIPVSSGLAGGSTDAAATLKGLNQIYGEPFSKQQLLEIGATLGADVPFCILGGCAACEGLGDQMTTLPTLTAKYVMIVRGGEGISTPKAYSMIDQHFDALVNCEHGDYNAALDAVWANDIGKLISSAYNIFEEVILPIHSTAKRQKEILYEYGADFCMMSGSGPAIFAIFKDYMTANTAASAIRKFGAKAFICETI
ncbi:MAG: 4-(cytidine 5'-diphospho)-2-C-methyl-D-erythritol kinase [Clostridia bacterium]|nr:4-(cytidine 5'-diphospho)-2-C-methyl-D-erythritol kinase [Clostridia bacterium]